MSAVVEMVVVCYDVLIKENIHSLTLNFCDTESNENIFLLFLPLWHLVSINCGHNKNGYQWNLLETVLTRKYKQ